jgi:CrcB protein
MSALFIAVGGALGAVLRYFVTHLFAFPFGTAVVNVVGSFLIGIAFVVLVQDKTLSKYVPLVMTGLLGGFTTFSTFSLDTLLMIERGEIGAATLNVLGTVTLCLLACAAGLWFARLALT